MSLALLSADSRTRRTRDGPADAFRRPRGRCSAVLLPAVEAGLANRCAAVVVASGWVVAGSGDLAVDRRAADREQLGELSDRVLAGLGESEDVDALAGAQLRRLALEPAVGACDRHSFPRAHPQQIDLELGEGRQDVEEHLAHRVGGVIHRPADREPHAAGGQRVADRARVGDRAREPVELGHHERVALAHGGQGLLQAGTAAIAAGHAVIEIHPVVADPELAQRVALRGEILLVSRTARVADQDAGTGPNGRPGCPPELRGATAIGGLAMG